jgi:outer membrane receptor for ferric coprogen and ferric-rhodotorulic acid
MTTVQAVTADTIREDDDIMHDGEPKTVWFLTTRSSDGQVTLDLIAYDGDRVQIVRPAKGLVHRVIR